MPLSFSLSPSLSSSRLRICYSSRRLKASFVPASGLQLRSSFRPRATFKPPASCICSILSLSFHSPKTLSHSHSTVPPSPIAPTTTPCFDFEFDDLNLPTLPTARKQPPRAGNFGHITRISNKLVQLGNSNNHIQEFLQVVMQHYSKLSRLLNCLMNAGYQSLTEKLRSTLHDNLPTSMNEIGSVTSCENV